MTESIKQEIINNIFENGDKLITGPVLQTVLIDMIDDVNVKDQAILSKTGSWDDAATQIPNLATKEEVTNLSESVARDLENVVGGDLTGYATEQWVQSQGYLTEHQDISGLATKTELTEAKDNLQGNITSLSESVARDLANVSVPEGVATEAWVQSQDYASKSYVDNAVSSVDLTGYATETWVEGQGYLKEHQDISGLATKTELNDTKNNLQGNITSLSESVARDIANVDVDLTGYATETWVQNQGYLTEHQDISNLATKTELTSVSESIQTDISNLATKGELNEAKNTLQGNITSLSESVARDLTGYATETWVQSQGYLKEHQDISGLATKGELTSVSESVQTDITNLSESVANSAVWKKGTGTDSIVQVIADGTNLPTATGRRAVATGLDTKASGLASHAEGNHTEASKDNSHAEGTWTNASGLNSHAEGDNTDASGGSSHAEGIWTNASGQWSHAEGHFTRATNDYEHAQGTYNHNSPNQIFSIGAGEFEGGVSTRRNAVSVLAVPNADTKINTASFFVQNIGGYDGTNPEPGTNDLATVINNLPSGGSSETLWKKGIGEDSLVQKLTGANETNTPTATGLGAIAIGTATTASGNNSHAEGQTTVASGLASHAEGYNTIASAHCSHAEGGDTKASGSYSHAEGIYTEALGQASHTEGYRTTASKEGSHAEGESTIASGSYSHAEGGYTLTSNQYEHAQGTYNHNSANQIFSVGAGEKIGETVTRRNAVSILEVPNSETQVVTASFFVQNVGGYDGTNPEPGTNDLATVINNLPSGGGSSETLWKKGEGIDSIVQATAGGTEQPTATGKRAIAVGYETIASGLASHAEGYNAKASGQCSHAEGYGAIASGYYSHAEGGTSKALGDYCHAEGSYTTASRNYSHAEGGFTKALGDASHAEGYSTVASNNHEHAQGRYNHSSANQIFSIGTGNSDTDRRNAVSVLEVSNNNSYTSSFFVQNIGGYDGTNPIPGTNDLATVINNLPSGGGSSSGGSSETLWKKGTGTDSMVQVLTGDDEANTSTATGKRAIAVGFRTNASGYGSYAEGSYSHAEGNSSHAEGVYTEAKGVHSHAEGFNTIASNDYEHAQGAYNHSSTNQIFSVGAGESIKDPDTQVVTVTRRNAVSVLAVPNSETQILTSSLFVQNVGGYDGTNPLPGTNDLATVINGMSTGGGSSETLWKKGEGQNSIVQILTGNDEAYAPVATGPGAVAIGFQTTASGDYSHAEGENTEASGQGSHAEGCGTNAFGQDSHAEGYYTTASGDWSHAEGYFTVAPNSYECVLGMCNHSSEGQIFSVGAGEGDPFNPFDPKPITRRNAISILAVPNSETQINTASVFIQNIGGYDGTNPTPGTNDLATVINGMSTGGGIGTSSETWTFTLEDGSTVTKNIVMR